MKRSCFALAALAFGVFALACCGRTGAPTAGGSDVPPAAEESAEPPAASPLAVLDTLNVSAAFVSDDGESLALKAAGESDAAYGFSLTSEVSGENKVDAAFGCTVGLEDVFGFRADETRPLGVDLFGGGEASFALSYRGPRADSELVSKNFAAGFRHDGDWILYAGEGGNEAEIDLADFGEKIGNAVRTGAYERMGNAALTVPDELRKGVSLRLAVEKLIDLGFTAEIDDTDGIAVTLRANEGFYTDLLNDFMEEFLPADWLLYIPRTDFRYEKKLFEIRLAFGADGRFREYSVSSDVALTASLEVRELFVSTSEFRVGGAFSIEAYGGAIPSPDDASSGTAGSESSGENA